MIEGHGALGKTPCVEDPFETPFSCKTSHEHVLEGTHSLLAESELNLCPFSRKPG